MVAIVLHLRQNKHIQNTGCNQATLAWDKKHSRTDDTFKSPKQQKKNFKRYYLKDCHPASPWIK